VTTSSANIPAPPPLNEAVLRQIPATLDRAALIDRWIARATFHSIKVNRATTDTLNAALDTCLAPHQVTRSILNAHDFDARLTAYLTAKSIHIIPWASPSCAREAFT